MFFRKVVPGSVSRLTIVDHRESYGRHILQKAIKNKQIMNCVDIGCGDGSDLSIISAHNVHAKLYGIDFGDWNAQKLKKLNIIPLYANIEIEKLPFDDNSIDFIIANQVIEHTKEIFWINHEIFRCLKVGGFPDQEKNRKRKRWHQEREHAGYSLWKGIKLRSPKTVNFAKAGANIFIEAVHIFL